MSSLPSETRGPGRHPRVGDRAERFRAFVQRPTFPCVAARAALGQGGVRMLELGTLGAPANAPALLDALARLAAAFAAPGRDPLRLHSLAAIFDGPSGMDEDAFEARLWDQLAQLHALDVARGQAWAGDVGDDPDSPDFSFSLAGHPFFVIGLHDGASRRARRFAQPVLVFNSQRQFAHLRADGRYAKMQAATRARDFALQGSLNPNLADWGTAPETRQYSGRAVEADWKCPFRKLAR